MQLSKHYTLYYFEGLINIGLIRINISHGCWASSLANSFRHVNGKKTSGGDL